MVLKFHPPSGSRPGTLVRREGADPTVVRVYRYDSEQLEQLDITTIDELEQAVDRSRRIWIDVQGLRDIEILEELARLFGIHPLALEDAVNVPQRPGCQPFGDHLLLIAAMVRPDTLAELEQLSLFVGDGWVVSVQERQGDELEQIRDRLTKPNNIRKLGADYLAYALLDGVIDAYYPRLEELGESLEMLENEILLDPKPELLLELNQQKRHLVSLRRAIWPLRDAMNDLLRDNHDLIREETLVFFRDCADHCTQTLDVTENYREQVSNLMSAYLSVVGQKTNEVMQVLTIMASLFIPLTFLAGIYGMNFEYMPELQHRYSYPILLGVMFVVAAVMMVYFWRKGWLRSGARQIHDATSTRTETRR